MAKFSGPKSLLNGMYVKSYTHMKNKKTISKVNDEDFSDFSGSRTYIINVEEESVWDVLWWLLV